jgi:nicotinate-nucleotide--dimethylbenzimidazole phosphoribosyltransferase
VCILMPERWKVDIGPLSEHAMEAAQRRLDSLTKPLGSLGRLEEYAVRLAGVYGYVGGTLAKKAILVFAADNGVYAQGITPVPKEVTAIQTENIARGIAGVAVLARQAGADVVVYNVGVELPVRVENIVDRVVMRSTQDMTQGPAMNREQCEQAMRVGWDAVTEHAGCDVIGLGEMGICNTTTTAAVACVLLGRPPEEMVGRGAGITKEQFMRKTDAVRCAVKKNHPNKEDVIDVMAKVGGLDIAAMTGAYLACAQMRIPVVIDGYISACAALCAARIAPGVREYMFASHKSFEPGYQYIIQALHMRSAFDLEMRLGEGSGCPLMFYVLEAALRVIDDMGTFEEGNVDPDGFVDLREI